MKQRYLEVSFRKGKPFAAYLYLPRPTGAKAAATRPLGKGMNLDLDADGRPIGVEITAPTAITIADLNAVLSAHGVEQLAADEWSPLAA